MDVDVVPHELQNIWSHLFRDLISRLEKMSKKPVVDDNLGETLDIFINRLNETQEYLSNGIVNIRFAEAALFLQNSVALYGKKVDILFDNTLQYQMQLCSYKQNEESEIEMTKIESRMRKKGKRKSFVPKISINQASDMLRNLTKKSKKFCAKVAHIDLSEEAIEVRDPFPIREGIVSDDDSGLSDITIKRFLLDSEVIIDYPIYCVRTNEKVCNSNDLFSRRLFFLGHDRQTNIPIDNSELEADVQIEEPSVSDDEVRSLCLSKSAVVNVTRLPQHVIDSFRTSNEDLVRALIHRLIADATNMNSEGASIQSLLQKQVLNCSKDHECTTTSPSQILCSNNQMCSLRRSNDDSGIFCSHVSNTVMETDEQGFTSNHATPEENETAQDSGLAAEATISITDVTVSQAILTRHQLNLRSLFQPMMTSTPKTLVPVVKLERLSRKRMAQFDKSNKQPKVKKPRFKWLKTTVTTQKIFEKFYSHNYNPTGDEGVIIPYEDSSDEENDNTDNHDMELETTDLANLEGTNNSTIEFCKSIVCGIVDNLTIDIPETEALNNEPSTSNVVSANIPPPKKQPIPAIPKVWNMMNWRDFIEPIIEKSERQSKFNIHDYGTQLMDAIPEGENLPFKNVVAGESGAEIARYFLALLQLANTNNVELLNTCPGEIANEHLEMKLLSRERYHEHLDQYEPPSENTIKEKLAKVKALKRDSFGLFLGEASYVPIVPQLSPTLQNKKQYQNRTKRRKKE